MSFDQHIINPRTNKPVKIGGRVYMNLIRDGILKNQNYKDPKILDTIDEKDNEEDIIIKKKKIKENLNINEDVVKGRGKYKNKLIKKHKQPKTEDVIRHTLKKTSKKLKDKKIYDKIYETDNYEDDFEKLMLKELNNICNEPVKTKKPVKKVKYDHSNHYQSESEYSESETEQSEEYTE